MSSGGSFARTCFFFRLYGVSAVQEVKASVQDPLGSSQVSPPWGHWSRHFPKLPPINTKEMLQLGSGLPLADWLEVEPDSRIKYDNRACLDGATVTASLKFPHLSEICI